MVEIEVFHQLPDLVQLSFSLYGLQLWVPANASPRTFFARLFTPTITHVQRIRQ